tara:strand:- start:344 stop:604 length:261 start_codon:yes stop_codon:yes gene_type:complete
MSYIKNSLPDDWEPDPYLKKYLCIGNRHIKSQWLPRWYGVPYNECLFDLQNYHYSDIQLIKLTVRPDNDYEEYLKILKTEHLLTGE